jgi:hypothetical protein
MASPDSVGQNTQDSFGSYRISIARNVSLGTVANAVATLPVLNGGMQGTGGIILRRIVVSNLYNTAGGTVPSAATANITIGTTNDGANLVTGTVTLTNLTNGTSYVDMTPGSGLNANTAAIVFQPNALFVNVTANVANAACQIALYGDVVSF